MRKPFLWSWLASFGVILTLFANVAKQGSPVRIVIGSEIACPECSIVLDTTTSPREPASSGGGIVVDGRGRRFLVGALPRWVHVLDRDGMRIAYLGKELKRPGYSFALQQPHIGPGDTIFLEESRRIAVYEPERLRFVRLASVARGLEVDEICPGPGGTFVTLFKKKSALITGLGVSEEASVAVFDHRGRLVRQFLVASQESGPSLNYPRTEIHDSALWITSGRAYAPTLWNLRGEKLIEVDRRADWFPKYIPPRRSPGLIIDEYPPPTVLALWQDSAGLLWTISSVTTRHRKLVPPYRVNQDGEIIGKDPRLEMPREPRDIDTTMTIIEVLDLTNGRLLASRTLRRPPDYFPAVWNGGLAATVDDQSSGPAIRTVRYRLVRPLR